MFTSRKAKLSNSDIGTGQSIFDFLKRKKRVSLQDSIKKQSKQHIEMSNISLNQKEDDLELVEAQTARNHNQRKNISQRITPKKVTFADHQQRKQTARTFIDMISPLKGKKSSFISQQIYQEEQPRSNLKSNKKSNTAQKEHSRKQLNNSINLIKQTILKLVTVGKNLKQKSHSLFIDIKPVIKIAEQNDNKIIRKKVQDAKQKLRTMQFQFGELDVKNASQIIQSFHKAISNHLVSYQAKQKSAYEKSQIQSLANLRTQKDNKINQLTDKNKSLQQSINILQRKIQKLQSNLQRTKQQEQKKFETYHESNQQKYQRLQNCLKQLEEDKSSLAQKVGQLESKIKQKEKQIKNLVHVKQTIERRFLQKGQQQKNARQQFLLNQIMILKQQFQNDIKQLTGLYAAKQGENIQIINQQKREIIELKEFLEKNRENQKRNNIDGDNLRLVLAKYRRQNQCLVTDMHRMNEQLYQHWLALKDIKILATRLQIMPKFVKIYEDLAFNDLLFE